MKNYGFMNKDGALLYTVFLYKYNETIDEYETLAWTVSPKIT